MKQFTAEIKKGYLKLGKMTKAMINVTVMFVCSLIIGSFFCYISKDFSQHYYDMLLLSENLLNSARSIIGLGVIFTIIIKVIEKRPETE